VGGADIGFVVPPQADYVDKFGVIGEQIRQGIGISGVPRTLPAADYVYWIIQLASLPGFVLQCRVGTPDY